MSKKTPPLESIQQLAALFESAYFTEGEIVAQRLLADYPDDGLTWTFLGAYLQSQGKDAHVALENSVRLNPHDPIAANNWGNELRGLGQLDAAEQSFRRALALKPDFAEAHCNLGAVLANRGDLHAAVASYRLALELNPEFAQAHGNLGSALKGLGKLQEAADSYQSALNIKPDFADAHYNLAITQKDLGQLDGAVQSFQTTVVLNPGFFEGHNGLAAVLNDLGRFVEAAESYAQALAIKPDFIQSICNLGLVQKNLGQFENAVRSYQRALAINPDFSQAHCNLGAVLADMGQQAQAISSYHRALAARPDFPEAYCNLGTALRELGQLDEALDCYAQALRLKPDFAEAHCNLGSTLKDLGRLDDAERSYRQSLDLSPEFANAHSGLADTLRIRGRHEEAARCFQLALQYKPDCIETRMSESALHLQRGDFAIGWMKYECRWEKKETRHIVFPGTLWLGEASLVGKTILLYSEQGLGDTLQFSRFVSRLADLGARVLLACPLSLQRLMRTVRGMGQVIAPGEELPAHDFYCPLLSLPLALHISDEAHIPANLPYLSAPPAGVVLWGKNIASVEQKLRVGIAWAGNPGFKRDKQRSLSFKALSPLLEIDGVDFYSLQKGDVAVAELAASPFNDKVHDYTAEWHDFSDTAAFLANLDLVVTIDSSVAHLAGAMGKRVWLLNRYDTCWRCMLARNDSPWYPEVMRIFRQPQPGQWQTVIDQVAHALRLEVGAMDEKNSVLSFLSTAT